MPKPSSVSGEAGKLPGIFAALDMLAILDATPCVVLILATRCMSETVLPRWPGSGPRAREHKCSVDHAAARGEVANRFEHRSVRGEFSCERLGIAAAEIESIDRRQFAIAAWREVDEFRAECAESIQIVFVIKLKSVVVGDADSA